MISRRWLHLNKFISLWIALTIAVNTSPKCEVLQAAEVLSENLGQRFILSSLTHCEIDNPWMTSEVCNELVLRGGPKVITFKTPRLIKNGVRGGIRYG